MAGCQLFFPDYCAIWPGIQTGNLWVANASLTSRARATLKTHRVTCPRPGRRAGSLGCWSSPVCLSFLVSRGGGNATHPRCLQVVKAGASVRRRQRQHPRPPQPSNCPNPTTTATDSTAPTWSNKRGVCEWKPSSVILKKSSLPQ